MLRSTILDTGFCRPDRSPVVTEIARLRRVMHREVAVERCPQRLREPAARSWLVPTGEAAGRRVAGHTAERLGVVDEGRHVRLVPRAVEDATVEGRVDRLLRPVVGIDHRTGDER